MTGENRLALLLPGTVAANGAYAGSSPRPGRKTLPGTIAAAR